MSINPISGHDGDWTTRNVAIATIPSVTGALSVLGSTWIVVDIVRDRKKWQTVYHRLLLGMAISDILASLCLAFSTRPIPEDTVNPVYGASGTLTTCEVQGFFIQVGLATTLYSAFLAIYFWIQVANPHWREGCQQLKYLEAFFHAVAWSLALGTASASLGLDLINNANLWCWMAPMPLECVNSIRANEGEGDCVRGDNAWVYRLFFYFIWLWLAVLAVFLSMFMIFRAVYKQGQKMQKYQIKGQGPSKIQGRMMRKVAVQSTLYIFAFLFTALPLSMVRGFQADENCTSEFFWLSIMTSFLFPLQGFWNFVIYMRPRYMKYRKEKDSSGVWNSLHRSIKRSFVISDPNDNDYKLGTALEGEDLTEDMSSSTNAAEDYLTPCDRSEVGSLFTTLIGEVIETQVFI